MALILIRPIPYPLLTIQELSDLVLKQWHGPAVIPTDGTREIYLYRKTFKVPAAAFNLNADVAIASDNYGWLYVNGEEVLAPRDLTENDRNFEAPPSTGIIAPRLLFAITYWLPKSKMAAGTAVDPPLKPTVLPGPYSH